MFPEVERYLLQGQSSDHSRDVGEVGGFHLTEHIRIITILWRDEHHFLVVVSKSGRVEGEEERAFAELEGRS